MTTEVDGQLAAVHSRPEPAKPRWRRAIVATTVVLAMLLTGTGLAPTVLMHTSLRDQVLATAIKGDSWTATSGDASGGWLAPLVFRDVRIADPNGRFLCTIRELRTSKGLLGFLTGGENIGRITLVEPHVELHVSEDGQWPVSENRPSTTKLSYVIENGSLLITVPWRKLPIIDLDDLAMSGRIAPNADGRRTLTVDPVQVFDHEPLSDVHTEQNLALIAPVLSQSTQLEGSASAWLDELQLPLDGTLKSPFPIRGRVEFHSMEARLKDAWVRQLAAITGQLTGKDVPSRLLVLKDCRVDFIVTDEGIHHESMVFLLPEIAESLKVASSGVVHLDETLDLRLSVTIPKVVSAGNPFLTMLGQLSSEPLELAVKGTVSKPQLQLPENTDLLGEISRRVTPAQYQEEPPAVTSAVADLITGAARADKVEAGKDMPGKILNLIRAIDQSVKNNPKDKSATKDKPKKSRRKK